MNAQAIGYGAVAGVVAALTGSKRKRGRRAVVGGLLGFLGYHAAARAGVNLPALPFAGGWQL